MFRNLAITYTRYIFILYTFYLVQKSFKLNYLRRPLVSMRKILQPLLLLDFFAFVAEDSWCGCYASVFNKGGER